MSALWGARIQRAGVLVVSSMLSMGLVSCEYSTEDDRPAPASAVASGPAQSFEGNLATVKELLNGTETKGRLKYETGRTPGWSEDLAPGDYMVTAACAGSEKGKVHILQADKQPIMAEFPCKWPHERIIRHAGGPVAVDASAAYGGPEAAAGVTVQLNTNPAAKAWADQEEWSSQALNPRLDGELRGLSQSAEPTSYGLSAGSGTYELHFVCKGTAGVELSVFSSAEAEVLKAVHVPCGGIFHATVHLATEGAHFRMIPQEGTGTYAFRLIPTQQPGPPDGP